MFWPSVVVSKSHGNGQILDKFLENYKVVQLVKKGSSLKICAVAAGGEIKQECKTPLRYKTDDPTFLNPFFIASGFE